MVNWVCSICGKKAEYHVCYHEKHNYYCVEHWFNGNPTHLDEFSPYVQIIRRVRRQGPRAKHKVKK